MQRSRGKGAAREALTPTGYKSIDIGRGLALLVDVDFANDDDSREMVDDVVLHCRAIVLGRDGMIARITECIEQLVKIDEANGGQELGLVLLSEMTGWTSNCNSHTARDYQRALVALLPTLNDQDLEAALSVAEFEVAKAANAEVAA